MLVKFLEQNKWIIAGVSFIIFNIGFPFLTYILYTDNHPILGTIFLILSIIIWVATFANDLIMQKLMQKYWKYA